MSDQPDGFYDERRAVHVVYLDISKVFDTVCTSCSILTVELVRGGLHNWVENWLQYWAERIVISDTMSIWQQAIRVFLRVGS